VDIDQGRLDLRAAVGIAVEIIEAAFAAQGNSLDDMIAGRCRAGG
jgi:hypothetical protein